MKTSQAGIDLIKEYESTKLVAYRCPANKWTLGTGSTFWPDGTPVKEGDTVTEQGAEDLLSATLVSFEIALEKMLKVPVSQNQWDALTSFIFNVGAENLRGSTLIKMLNAGRPEYAAQEFDKWVFAKGAKLPGLVKRRAAERALFES